MSLWCSIYLRHEIIGRCRLTQSLRISMIASKVLTYDELRSCAWSMLLCGDYINTTYFLEQAGMSPTDTFDLGLGQNGLASVGTALSWVLMSSLGRRIMYLMGITIMGTILFIVGCFALADRKGPLEVQGILFMIFIFSYDLTIGPVVLSLVAELSSTRLRQKSIVLARNVYNLIGLAASAASTILPYQTNQSAWNWKGKLGFFWFGSCLWCFIWI
jgi:SP family general alpha glucoside:H+ symporter-like MFS transporter